MSHAKTKGNNQAQAGMGADEANHQDRGKPKASTTCRMRVLPKTLKTSPVNVAATQGQGGSKVMLSSQVKTIQAPDHVSRAGMGHVSQRNTGLTSLVQLANEFAALFNFDFRVVQLARNLAGLANHQ